MAACAGVCVLVAGGWGELGAGGTRPRTVAAAAGDAGCTGCGWFGVAGWGRPLSAVRGDAFGAAGYGSRSAGAAGVGGVQAGAGRRSYP